MAGDVENTGGSVAPGNSPGVLIRFGQLHPRILPQLSKSKWPVTAGPGEGGHDQLAVGGIATLDGTLDIQTDSSFTPERRRHAGHGGR